MILSICLFTYIAVALVILVKFHGTPEAWAFAIMWPTLVAIGVFQRFKR